MNGKIIKEVHSCGLLWPEPTDYAIGTVWLCDCGKEFTLRYAAQRVPTPWWYWSNAPQKPKRTNRLIALIKGENK